MNGDEIIALIDSASTDNFINFRLLTETQKAEMNCQVQKIDLAIPSATMDVQGKLSIAIKFGNKTILLPCLVSSQLRECLILELEWIHRQKIVMDIPNGRVYAGIQVRSTLYSTSHNDIRTEDIQKIVVENRVPTECKDEFQTLMQRYRNTLDPQGRITRTKSAQHTLKLTNNKPFRFRPYPCSEEKRNIILEHVDNMLKEDVIEACEAEYCSPIVPAKKKNGKIRFCMDYRRLNQITEEATHTLPRM